MKKMIRKSYILIFSTMSLIIGSNVIVFTILGKVIEAHITKYQKDTVKSIIQALQLDIVQIMSRTVFGIFVFFALTLLLLFYLIRQKIINPCDIFEKELEAISITNDIGYRLPIGNQNELFYPLRQLINKVLDQSEEFYEQQQLDLLHKSRILHESERRNKAILNVLPDLLFIYDANGTFLDCQTNDTTNLMLSKDEFIGKRMDEIMPRNISDKGLRCISEVLTKECTKKFEYSLCVGNEKKYFETRMVSCAKDQVLAIVRDITLETLDKDRIIELSYRDHLTGVFNRRYFEEEIEKLDSEQFLPLAIVMIDVNGLKLTNDAFGHLLGDELLKKVAINIRRCCTTPRGFVARIGGDEFVAVCPFYNHKQIESLVNKLYHFNERDKLENTVISISAGWAIRNEMTQTIREVFIKAENQMFRKKIVESQSMRNKTIQVIMQTLNEKNEREKRHSVAVSKWSKKLGEAMNFDSQMLKELEAASLVHDIGKIAIREELLNKPGKLTDKEYDEIKRHAESGYQILKSVDAYSSLAEEVLFHHERFDGKGYPRGLKGDEIPLIARVIAIADAYDAMIADRSYRKGMTHENALKEIISCSGTQFDPQISKAFVNMFASYSV